MNTNRFIRDVAIAFCAQGIAMPVSVVTTLLAPKALGIGGYGDVSA